jgi:hypothetical protein
MMMTMTQQLVGVKGSDWHWMGFPNVNILVSCEICFNDCNAMNGANEKSILKLLNRHH